LWDGVGKGKEKEIIEERNGMEWKEGVVVYILYDR